MSSRLTAPVSKFTRCISTTPSIARPSHVLNNGGQNATTTKSNNPGRKRLPKSTTTPSTDATTADYSTSSTTTPHRPVPPPAARKLPLMQGFRTSAPKPARMFTMPTVDTTVLPDLRASESAHDPYAYIRVPLLPDNTLPVPQMFRAPEAADEPLPAAQISVVAANPDAVLPAALTEVEGMGVDGVELKFAHELGREGEKGREEGQGMLRDIWKGLVDDVFGERSGKMA